MNKEKPTIHELEAKMDENNPGAVKINPDGSVTVETDTETIVRLQAALKSEQEKVKELKADMVRILTDLTRKAKRANAQKALIDGLEERNPSTPSEYAEFDGKVDGWNKAIRHIKAEFKKL